MSSDNWIGIVIPTKDGKYVVARATITNDNVEKLSDCVIAVSDIAGVKSDLKYPFVLLSDINTLREKLIEDIVDEVFGFYPFDSPREIVRKDISVIINKRFGYEKEK